VVSARSLAGQQNGYAQIAKGSAARAHCDGRHCCPKSTMLFSTARGVGMTPESDNSKIALTPDDYQNSATLLATKVLEIVRSARGWSPPFKLHVTGVDDDDVVDVVIDQNAEMQLIVASRELTARFPLTATLTDADGRVLEMTVEPSKVI
jgi:hypothetical protein